MKTDLLDGLLRRYTARRCAVAAVRCSGWAAQALNKRIPHTLRLTLIVELPFVLFSCCMTSPPRGMAIAERCKNNKSARFRRFEGIHGKGFEPLTNCV